MDDPSGGANHSWIQESEQRRRNQQRSWLGVMAGFFVLTLVRAALAHTSLLGAVIQALVVSVGVIGALIVIFLISSRPKNIDHSQQFLALSPPWVLRQAGWQVNANDTVTLAGRLKIAADEIVWTPSRTRGPVQPHVRWANTDVSAVTVQSIPNITPLAYVTIALKNNQTAQMRVFQPKQIQLAFSENGYPAGA